MTSQRIQTELNNDNLRLPETSGQNRVATSVECMVRNGRQLNRYQHSASDGPKCYRFSADRYRLKLLFRVAAGNIVELIDSLNEDGPGPTNMSIADFAPHKKTPIASLPPASHQTLPSFYAL